jgi:hypothetical protein
MGGFFGIRPEWRIDLLNKHYTVCARRNGTDEIEIEMEMENVQGQCAELKVTPEDASGLFRIMARDMSVPRSISEFPLQQPARETRNDNRMENLLQHNIATMLTLSPYFTLLGPRFNIQQPRSLHRSKKYDFCMQH